MKFGMSSFQSIGDTKEWRPLQAKFGITDSTVRFQSIGVTKEWRLSNDTMTALDRRAVSNQ